MTENKDEGIDLELRALQRTTAVMRVFLVGALLVASMSVLVWVPQVNERMALNKADISCVASSGEFTDWGYETYLGVLPAPVRNWGLDRKLTGAERYADIVCGPTELREGREGQRYLVLTDRGRIELSYGSYDKWELRIVWFTFVVVALGLFSASVFCWIGAVMDRHTPVIGVGRRK